MNWRLDVTHRELARQGLDKTPDHAQKTEVGVTEPHQGRDFHGDSGHRSLIQAQEA